LPRFYLRRCLRIWPALYFFLLVMLLRGQTGLASVGLCALFVNNYDLALGSRLTEMHLPHLWSLAVEEQFYLLWPLVLRWAGRRVLPLVLGLLGIVAVWRGVLLLGGADWLRLTTAFDTRCDALLFGCLAALLWMQPSVRARLRGWLCRPALSLLVVAALLAVAATLGHPSRSGALLLWMVRLPLFHLLTALLLLTLAVQPAAVATRLLSQPVLVGLGRVSYSLYLWHPLAFAEYGRAGRFLSVPESLLAHPLIQEAGCLLLSLLTALLSYLFIEKPFLALKQRWGERPAHPAIPSATSRQAA
jgi:peptidoglycan/LPS O-acetylase OafA/YrhL